MHKLTALVSLPIVAAAVALGVEPASAAEAGRFLVYGRFATGA